MVDLRTVRQNHLEMLRIGLFAFGFIVHCLFDLEDVVEFVSGQVTQGLQSVFDKHMDILGNVFFLKYFFRTVLFGDQQEKVGYPQVSVWTGGQFEEPDKLYKRSPKGY